MGQSTWEGRWYICQAYSFSITLPVLQCPDNFSVTASVASNSATWKWEALKDQTGVGATTQHRSRTEQTPIKITCKSVIEDSLKRLFIYIAHYHTRMFIQYAIQKYKNRIKNGGSKKKKKVHRSTNV